MTTILLARHGETDWNREGRWQGHADRPLNAVGRAQARDLAAALSERGVDAIYSSDLKRAHETATIVARELGHPVTIDADLREVDVAEWSGLTSAEAEHRYPDAFRAWRHEGLHGWQGGETYEAMKDRVVRALVRIAAAHPAQTVLVVTHGGPIRASRADAAGVDYATSRLTHPGSPENCALVELKSADGRLQAAG